MDPLTIGLIGAGANVGGGILGNMLSSGDRSAALNALQNIYNQYAALKVPDIESQKVTPEQLAVMGQLDPEALQMAQLSNHDALQNVSLDPRLQKAQMDSLQQLQKIAGGGFSDADKAALQLALNRNEQDATARTQQMLQQQDQRGVGSSDAALAARLAQGQSSANRGAEAALQTALEGRNRAMQAMSQSANLASGIQNADYQRQAALADALNRREAQNINYQNQGNVVNTGARNAAQQFNLNNAQSVANQNVANNNTAQYHNKDLIQQNFNNQLQRLSGMSGQAGNISNAYNNNANRTANMWSGIGQGVGQGVMAYGANQNKAASPTTPTPQSIFGGTQSPSYENSYQDLMNTLKKTRGY